MELSHAQKENIGFAWLAGEVRCASPYGRQRLAALRPFAPAQRTALEAELANITRTLAARPALEAECTRLEHVMAQVKDIRASLRRIPGGVLGEVELFEVKRYLLQLAELGPLFAALNAEARYEGIAFAGTAPALALLDPEKTGVASFHISQRWSARLAALRREKRELEEALRVAPAGHTEELMARRRTLVAEEQAEEEAVRAMLTEKLRPYAEALLQNTEAIAALDLTLQKAALARRRGAVRPEMGAAELRAQDMINPMVADLLEREGERFTPVSLTLAPGATVITGANMGGKSVTLKTLALSVYLAHCGFFVFAREMRCPHFGALWLLSDDLEDTRRGLSSFGGEIVRFNEIVSHIGDAFSLILMDEFARGTNPEEGAAIARGVTAWLNEGQNIAVLATHFDGVAAEAGAHYQVVGLSGADIPALAAAVAAAPPEKRVGLIGRHMNFGLYRVGAAVHMPRDAINICKLLGLCSDITAKIEKRLLTIPPEGIK